MRSLKVNLAFDELAAAEGLATSRDVVADNGGGVTSLGGASEVPDGEEMVNLADGLVVDGYDYLTDHLAGRSGSFEPLDITLGAQVREISHGAAGVVVKLADGSEEHADMVIVTLPLGVLQRSPAEGGVAFSPPLSAAKRSAIDSLGMGTENKVALRWDPDDVFWPATQPYLQCSDPRFRFLNAHYFGKLGVLVVMVAPPFALSMEAMDDAGVLGVLLPMLRTTFAPKASELPPPIECHVTRWGTDPYCFGSYSYDKLGSAVAMRHDLRAAERAEGAPTPRLFFAGEACSTDAPQCVHGAVETGRLASDELLRALTLDSCCDEPAVESVLADGAPLQCMCRLLYDPRRETVQCVVCAQVYHTECVGFGQPSVEGEETALSPEDYRCYRCSILPDGLV